MKFISVIVLTLFFGMSLSFAAEPKEPPCKIITKAKAISLAQRNAGGKGLSASLNKSKKPPVYKVKVLKSDGRVKTIMVDGCSGRVIKVK